MREGWGDDVAVNQSERAWRSAILIWRTDLSATYPRLEEDRVTVHAAPPSQYASRSSSGR